MRKYIGIVTVLILITGVFMVPQKAYMAEASTTYEDFYIDIGTYNASLEVNGASVSNYIDSSSSYLSLGTISSGSDAKISVYWELTRDMLTETQLAMIEDNAEIYIKVEYVNLYSESYHDKIYITKFPGTSYYTTSNRQLGFMASVGEGYEITYFGNAPTVGSSSAMLNAQTVSTNVLGAGRVFDYLRGGIWFECTSVKYSTSPAVYGFTTRVWFSLNDTFAEGDSTVVEPETEESTEVSTEDSGVDESTEESTENGSGSGGSDDENDKLDSIVTPDPSDKEQADEYGSDMSDKVEQGADVLDQIGQMQKPDIDSVMPDDLLSDNEVDAMGTLMSTVQPLFSSNLFGRTMIVGLIMALVGYIFFGKR